MILNQLKLFLMVLSSEDILKAKEETTGVTLKQIQIILKKGYDIYTGKYGKAFMEQSPKIIAFITKTAIRLTMTYLILLWSKEGNTILNIAKNGQKKINSFSKNILKKLEKKPLNGINLQRVGIGIKNMLKKIILGSKKLIKNVYSATKRLKVGSIQNFAVINVNQNLEEILKLTISRRFASSAEENFQKINIAKTQLVANNVLGKYLGKKEVYSISVEDKPEYFANGILVRNSDSARYALHSWKVDNPGDAGVIMEHLQ